MSQSSSFLKQQIRLPTEGMLEQHSVSVYTGPHPYPRRHPTKNDSSLWSWCVRLRLLKKCDENSMIEIQLSFWQEKFSWHCSLQTGWASNEWSNNGESLNMSNHCLFLCTAQTSVHAYRSRGTMHSRGILITQFANFGVILNMWSSSYLPSDFPRARDNPENFSSSSHLATHVCATALLLRINCSVTCINSSWARVSVLSLFFIFAKLSQLPLNYLEHH